MELNPELLRKRLMRGALSGPPEAEKEPLRRCKGKHDDGRPCMITVLDGDFCRRHQKEIDAIEAGAPLKPGHIERTFEEKIKMSKKGTCKVCDKKDTHIIGAGMCWTCRKEAMEAGTYPEPASIVPAKSEAESASVNENPKLKHDKIDEAESAALAGGPLPGQCIIAGKGDCTHPGRTSCVDCPETGSDCPGREIARVVPAPPQEATVPCAELRLTLSEEGKGLAALLRAPSAPPVGMFIPFASEELAALDESEVTPEIIREFIIMGLEGKLTRLDDAAA